MSEPKPNDRAAAVAASEGASVEYLEPEELLDAARAAINGEGAKAVTEAAQVVADRIPPNVFGGIGVYVGEQQRLYKQQKEDGILGSVPFEWIIMLDYKVQPWKDGQPVPSLTMQLEPDPALGQQIKGYEKLIVSIPVDNDVVLDETFFDSSFNDPDFIPEYVVMELYDATGISRSFVVKAGEKLSEFQNAVDTGEQIDPEDYHYLQLVQDSLGSINPLDLMAFELIKRLTDWSVVPQYITPETTGTPEEEYDYPQDEYRADDGECA